MGMEALRSAGGWISTHANKAYNKIKEFINQPDELNILRTRESSKETFNEFGQLLKSHYKKQHRVSKRLASGTFCVTIAQILNLPSAIVGRIFNKNPKVGRWASVILPTSWVGLSFAYAGEKLLTSSGILIRDKDPTLNRIYSLSHMLTERRVPLSLNNEGLTRLDESELCLDSAREEDFDTELLADPDNKKELVGLANKLVYKPVIEAEGVEEAEEETNKIKEYVDHQRLKILNLIVNAKHENDFESIRLAIEGLQTALDKAKRGELTALREVALNFFENREFVVEEKRASRSSIKGDARLRKSTDNASSRRLKVMNNKTIDDLQLYTVKSMGNILASRLQVENPVLNCDPTSGPLYDIYGIINKKDLPPDLNRYPAFAQSLHFTSQSDMSVKCHVAKDLAPTAAWKGNKLKRTKGGEPNHVFAVEVPHYGLSLKEKAVALANAANAELNAVKHIGAEKEAYPLHPLGIESSDQEHFIRAATLMTEAILRGQSIDLSSQMPIYLVAKEFVEREVIPALKEGITRNELINKIIEAAVSSV